MGNRKPPSHIRQLNAAHSNIKAMTVANAISGNGFISEQQQTNNDEYKHASESVLPHDGTDKA